jgi:FixJ family two-component response regulator
MPREREVTALIVSGLLNKQVGSELDIGRSPSRRIKVK